MIRRIAVLATALLLAACGGGDPTVEEPVETNVIPSPEENEVPAEVGDGGALTELAGAWSQTSARVAYALTTGTTPTQAMTLYWMPPDSWRMDIGNETGSTIIISTAEGGYVCTGVEGASQCIESPADVSAQAPIPFAGLFASPEGLLDEIEAQSGGAELEQSSEEIAGLQAECFGVSGETATAGGDIQWCFSGTGILLRYSVESASTAGGGEFLMEATEVVDEVSEGDFEPPFPVTEIPDADG